MNDALEWLQFVLAPQMINGLSIGVAVVLMALGLTIIFGLLDVINMAHGEFYAIGAYLAGGKTTWPITQADADAFQPPTAVGAAPAAATPATTEASS